MLTISKPNAIATAAFSHHGVLRLRVSSDFDASTGWTINVPRASVLLTGALCSGGLWEYASTLEAPLGAPVFEKTKPIATKDKITVRIRRRLGGSVGLLSRSTN